MLGVIGMVEVGLRDGHERGLLLDNALHACSINRFIHLPISPFC